MEEAPLGWKKDILDYLRHEILPANKSKARKIKIQATRYTLVVDELYRKGFSSLLFKCLDRDQANCVL